MRRTHKQRMLTWALAASTGLLTIGQAGVLKADEHASFMYEDDAWYDVTEWFDGNDYNPTDEQWLRWDNETYEDTAAANSTDGDNDTFGFYNNSTVDDWYYDYDYSSYYDYYDYNYDGKYEISANYYDYDNDGYYDAYSSYTDTDGDGFYEDYDYLSFANAGYDQSQADNAKKDAKAQASDRSSKTYRVSGMVAATKEVQCQGGERLLAHVVDQGQKFVVDLGPTEQLNESNLSVDDQLTASGPLAKVGDKQVLIAQEIEHKGSSMKVDRSPRSLSGTIVETMKAKPRKDASTTHMMVKLKTDGGKQALVDLGPAERMSRELKRDQKLEVSGVAVKIKDRPVLFANNFTIDGNQVSIDRRVDEGQRQASTGATSTQK